VPKKPSEGKIKKPGVYDKLSTGELFNQVPGKKGASLNKTVKNHLKTFESKLKKEKILEKPTPKNIKKFESDLFEMGMLLSAIKNKAPKQGVSTDTKDFLIARNEEFKTHLEDLVEAGAKPAFKKRPLSQDIKKGLVKFNDLKEKIMTTTKEAQKKHLIEMTRLVKILKTKSKKATSQSKETLLLIMGMSVTYDSLKTIITKLNSIAHGQVAKAGLGVEEPPSLQTKPVLEIPVPHMEKNTMELEILALHNSKTFRTKNLIRKLILPDAGLEYEPTKNAEKWEKAIQEPNRQTRMLHNRLGLEGYQIDTYDGKDKLHCYIHEPKKMAKDAPLLLWFPGNAETAISGLNWLQTGKQEHFPCATFSYRGCGFSTANSEEVREMSELTIKEDALAYMMALMKKFPDRPVVLVGHSLGGGLASAMAKVLVENPNLKGRLKGLILTQSFNRFDSAAYTLGSLGRVGFNLKRKFGHGRVDLFAGTGLAAQKFVRKGWPEPSENAENINKTKLGGILEQDFFDTSDKLKSLRESNTPVFMIHAEKDHMMKPSMHKKNGEARYGKEGWKKAKKKYFAVLKKKPKTKGMPKQTANHGSDPLLDPDIKNKALHFITGKTYEFKIKKSGNYHNLTVGALYKSGFIASTLRTKVTNRLYDLDEILNTGEGIQEPDPKKIRELGSRLNEMGKLLAEIKKKNPKKPKSSSTKLELETLNKNYKNHLENRVKAAAKPRPKKDVGQRKSINKFFAQSTIRRKEKGVLKHEVLVEFNKLREDINEKYKTEDVGKDLLKMKKFVSSVKQASESKKVKPLSKGTLLLIEGMSVTYNSLKKKVDDRAQEILDLEKPSRSDEDDTESKTIPKHRKLKHRKLKRPSPKFEIKKEKDERAQEILDLEKQDTSDDDSDDDFEDKMDRFPEIQI